MNFPPDYHTPDTVRRAYNYGARSYKYTQDAPLTWAEFFSAEATPHDFRGSLYDAYLKGWHWSAGRHAAKVTA